MDILICPRVFDALASALLTRLSSPRCKSPGRPWPGRRGPSSSWQPHRCGPLCWCRELPPTSLTSLDTLGFCATVTDRIADRHRKQTKIGAGSDAGFGRSDSLRGTSAFASLNAAVGYYLKCKISSIILSNVRSFLGQCHSATTHNNLEEIVVADSEKCGN